LSGWNNTNGWATGDNPHFVATADLNYVFVGSGSEWQQQAKLTPAAGVDGEMGGSVVTLSGMIGAFGAPTADIDSNNDQGKVYFFQRQPFESYLPLIVR
jgi:hypothetical protein